MLDRIYKQHISELPTLKTLISKNYIKDIIGMIEKKPVIDFILDVGTKTFNIDYAERLSHLILIEKLKIENTETWLNLNSNHKPVEINAYNILINGTFNKSNVEKKPFMIFLSEIAQQVIAQIKKDKYCKIKIINLLESIAIYYRKILNSTKVLGYPTSSTYLKNGYLLHCLNTFFELLSVELDEENIISIEIIDRSIESIKESFADNIVNKKHIYDDLKFMIEKFIDCYSALNISDNRKSNLPHIDLCILRNTYRSPFTIMFEEYSTLNGINLIYKNDLRMIASEVILDFSKISKYNLHANDIESSLKDLYIDAQGINQIKRYSLAENTKNEYSGYLLNVKVINIDKTKKDLIMKVLDDETKRLTNAYMDKFSYEIVE